MFTRVAKLRRRASELKKCLYCDNSLPAESKEHIFNSSWGSSYEDGYLICHVCNNEFSNPIDTAFTPYVVEDTHGSTKPPQSMFAEFDSSQLVVPLIHPQFFSCSQKTYKYFRNEFQELMGVYYPIDAITARCIQGIKTLNKRELKLDQTTLEEYLCLFLNCFSQLSKITTSPVDFR
jgi:hypothetical protein